MDELALNPCLLHIPLYVAGKCPEQVCYELGIREAVKLCSNENPLGPSPMALAALQSGLTQINRYPGVAEYELRQKLAAYHGAGLTAEHFVVGNGATDVLRMIAQAFIFDGGEALTSRVTFPLFALLTLMYGGQVTLVDLCTDYHIDLGAIAEAVTAHTRVVWLCSPNNPTGLILSQRAVDAFLRRLPAHVIVVFDQAYGDYVTDPEYAYPLRYVRQDRNVILVHTFSKSAGLANLRVGYAIARPDLIMSLRHAVLPFNTSSLALVAAAASLDDHVFRRRGQLLVRRERDRLFVGLSEMGLTCLPSQANFVLVTDPPGGAPGWVEALLQQGLIVRPMAGFGLPNALRVSVGLPEQNERFLAAVRAILVGTLARVA